MTATHTHVIDAHKARVASHLRLAVNDPKLTEADRALAESWAGPVPFVPVIVPEVDAPVAAGSRS